MIIEKKIQVEKIDPLILYGLQDCNIKLLSQLFNVQIIGRGNMLKLIGEDKDVNELFDAVNEIIYMIKKNGEIQEDDIYKVAHIIRDNHEIIDKEIMEKEKAAKTSKLDDFVLTTHRGVISTRTDGQKKFIKTIKNHDVVFAIGPAGTGKTYLAVAMAVAALKNKEVLKIILARPAVEAGESLGFLPGDLREKIDPYLRPLYDSLNEMIPRELLKKYFEQDIIEVTPLAYMRGRTLNNAFIILDEAQNTTTLQMKMVLTRLGINSKIVINGDVTQVDLPQKGTSALKEIKSIMKVIKGVEFCYLTKKDVVRHKLVKDIIQAYDNYEAKTKSKKNA